MAFKLRTSYKVTVTRVEEGILPAKEYVVIGKTVVDGKDTPEYGLKEIEKLQRIEATIYSCETNRKPNFHSLTDLMAGKRK